MLALGAILAAAVCLIRVEWLMTFHDPPDLLELVAAEQKIRHALDGDAAPPGAATVAHHYLGMLTGAASRRHFVGSNEASAKSRAWAVRFVVLALILLFLAHVALPFHQALGQ